MAGNSLGVSNRSKADGFLQHLALADRHSRGRPPLRRGKISELMGDVAKGVKSFKKGLADDDAPAADREQDRDRRAQQGRADQGQLGPPHAGLTDRVRAAESICHVRYRLVGTGGHRGRGDRRHRPEGPPARAAQRRASGPAR